MQVENQNPEEQVCQCGDDFNRFCSICTPERRRKVERRAESRRAKSERYGICKKITPPELPKGAITSRERKFRMEMARRIMQKQLGRKVTRREFDAYIAERAKHIHGETTVVSMLPEKAKLGTATESQINQAIGKVINK